MVGAMSDSNVRQTTMVHDPFSQSRSTNRAASVSIPTKNKYTDSPTGEFLLTSADGEDNASTLPFGQADW